MTGKGAEVTGPRSRFSLTGRTVVVTGAAGILGQAFCSGLHQAGARVIAVDVESSGLHDLKNDLVDLEVEVCDISDEQAVKTSVEALWDRVGPIDGLLNNAASKGAALTDFFTDFESSSLKSWREVSAVNLDGSYLMAREVGKRMAERGQGAIVQIASIYGVVAPDQRIYEGSDYLGHKISSPGVYSATKSGVLGLASFMATWWGDSGVRVNSLTPGGVASGQNQVFESRYSERVPLGRMADADDMVGPAVFLLSDASRYVTGHNLVVDGGLTAW